MSAVRIEHILCPVDRSEISRLALDHARALARWYGASLSVLEVVWPGMPPITIPTLAAAEAGWPLLTPEERIEYVRALDLFCGRAAADVVERHELAEGPIVEVILKRVAKEAADLVVMGTHGRSGFQHAVLGSITEKILRRAASPVVVVPPHASAEPHQPSLPYKTILCALDFSPASSRALRYGLSLAQESAATLVLTHVVEFPGAQRVRTEVEERLRDSVPDSARDWCKTREIALSGKPHIEIVQLATIEHADLLVIGVHSRPGGLTPFFGSTANQVVRHSRCPVLVVRP